MISLRTVSAAAAALIVVSAGAALAKDAKTAATTKHSPESIECSKQADDKGLHGKERKSFRSECMKGLKAGKTDTSKTDTSKPSDKTAPDKKS